MTRRVPAADATRRFADVLDEVSTAGEAVVVEQDGRPIAVFISAEHWQALDDGHARLGHDRRPA
jgi:prevent-host-death family protein